MKLNSFTLAGFIFILLFGGISFTSAMDWWRTETQKVPVKYAEGEASGQYNPADIRGSYTFGEVSELFGIPLADLQAAFQIPADSDPAAYQLKSLEEQFGDLPVEVGTASARVFVAFYKGLPFDLDAAEDAYLLEEAGVILTRQGRMTPDQSAYLSTHLTSLPADPEIQATPAPEAVEQLAPTVHAPEESVVTGKTSFQNLLDWGVTQEEIETVIGGAMPAPQTMVKDYASAQGVAFSELKGKLQEAVDLSR